MNKDIEKGLQYYRNIKKAIKITTDNKISVIDIQEPTLKGMQEQVGGNIEVERPFGFTYLNVPNKLSLVMIVNEEGLCIQLPLNLLGTRLYNYPEFDDEQPIVGDILIMAEGFVDGESDIVGLEDDQVEALLENLLEQFNFLKFEQKCRVCGCTEDNACPGGCYWVEDDLCSECVGKDIEIEIEINVIKEEK